MVDIFNYAPEVNPNDIINSDPTTLRGTPLEGTSTFALDTTGTLQYLVVLDGTSTFELVSSGEVSLGAVLTGSSTLTLSSSARMSRYIQPVPRYIVRTPLMAQILQPPWVVRGHVVKKPPNLLRQAARRAAEDAARTQSEDN